jgi:glycosyltransferase involved in cell wall biosynthesis
MRADAATSVSRELWEQMIREFPFLRGKGQVIHNGIPSSWYDHADEMGPPSADRYVLFVGRLRPVKGVDILLRAWQRLQPIVEETELWLAGAGEERNRLGHLAQELGVADRVRFLGVIGQRDLAPLYRHARLVVIPSRTEGLPRVALEAGLCGAICVAARVGGLPEVIDEGVTGVLVEPESPEALANGMIRVLRLPLGDRQHMSAAKRRIEHDFAHQSTAVRYERLFDSLLRTRIRRRS